MLVQLFPRMHGRYSSLRLLGPILDDFTAWLLDRGYPRSAARRHLRAARRLEQRWVRRGLRCLSAIRRTDFQVCASGHSQDDPDLAAVARALTTYFQDRRLLDSEPTPEAPRELTGYEQHRTGLRGLARATVAHHLTTASAFLQFIADKRPRGSLRQLTPGDVEAFVQAVAAGVSRATLQHVVALLRSFLRWLAAHGHASRGLESQIDTPRVYREEQLPRALRWETVRGLLQSIDRTTVTGRRDYAMLLLVATCGLRSSEVVALTLDEVAWRRGELRVPRRKVDSVLVVLPLTDAVGDAVLDYVRHGRPPQPTRVLFLRVRPPAGVLKPTAVTEVFQTRARRSGLAIPFQGPHCLRHSLAVQLLREGVSLKAIGDVLGHRTLESTCQYLRLATEDLRDVPLSLPANDTDASGGGASMTARPPRPTGFTSRLAACIEAHLRLKEALGRRCSTERTDDRTH
jgi:integrase/recombinase XerD